MRKHFAIQAAYYIIATAFTWALLMLVLISINFFFPSGSMHYYDNEIKINLRHLSKESKINLVVEQGPEKESEWYTTDSVTKATFYHRGLRHVMDTLSIADSQDGFALFYMRDPVVYLPVKYFKGSQLVSYYYVRIRAVLIMLIWVLLLYQFFLILYDLKRSAVFTNKNFSRMRRGGYLFFGLFVLNLLVFEFYGTVTSTGHFVLLEEKHIFFSKSSFVFLLIGLMFFAFSYLFKYGQLNQPGREQGVKESTQP